MKTLVAMAALSFHSLYTMRKLEIAIYYAPNFEKVGDILVSACPYVCMYVRGAIQNYVDFFYNFRTDNRPHMKLGIHII